LEEYVSQLNREGTLTLGASRDSSASLEFTEGRGDDRLISRYSGTIPSIPATTPEPVRRKLNTVPKCTQKSLDTFINHYLAKCPQDPLLHGMLQMGPRFNDPAEEAFQEFWKENQDVSKQKYCQGREKMAFWLNIRPSAVRTLNRFSFPYFLQDHHGTELVFGQFLSKSRLSIPSNVVLYPEEGDAYAPFASLFHHALFKPEKQELSFATFMNERHVVPSSYRKMVQLRVLSSLREHNRFFASVESSFFHSTNS
jgi:hypothetical protein